MKLQYKNHGFWNITTHDYADFIGMEYVTIPKGFRWNGCSIPNKLQKFIGDRYDPQFARASCVHDYLIAIDYDVDVRDEVFYDILIEDGVNKFKAKIMYYAVRLYSLVYFKMKADWIRKLLF